MYNFTGKACFAPKKVVRSRKISFRDGIADNRTADDLPVKHDWLNYAAFAAVAFQLAAENLSIASTTGAKAEIEADQYGCSL